MKSSLLLLSSLALCLACGDDATPTDAGGTPDTLETDAGPADVASAEDVPELMDAGSDTAAGEDSGPMDAGQDVGPVDPCEGAGFCETFDEYDPMGIEDGQRFGAWRARFEEENGNTMRIDNGRSVTGEQALHIHVPDGSRRGGRLFTVDDEPMFAGRPTEMHGRMMMYVEENGYSTHWTWGGLVGDVVDSAPIDGVRATYLFSSLNSDDANQFSAVYYTNTDPVRDCWNRSSLPIPAGRWMCVEFSADSEGRTVRFAVDGEEILNVNESGQGCVGGVSGDTPWYGPSMDQFYVGAWSFHELNGDLDVWIDDVLLDDAPIACP